MRVPRIGLRRPASTAAGQDPSRRPEPEESAILLLQLDLTNSVSSTSAATLHSDTSPCPDNSANGRPVRQRLAACHKTSPGAAASTRWSGKSTSASHPDPRCPCHQTRALPHTKYWGSQLTSPVGRSTDHNGQHHAADIGSDPQGSSSAE